MSESEPSRYLGETLGRRFSVDWLLGSGGFAWVYHAVDEVEGGEVAIKVLRNPDRSAALRFARETRVLAALPPNPYVAAYISHGRTHDGWPYLAIEYVDGSTLKEGMERCHLLSPDRAVAVTAELCGAFVELHRLGVAHRDIKPENILLANSGGIKLIDFGLIRDAQGILKLLESEDPFEQRVFQDEIDRRILVGTPEYMAPEQFSDATSQDLSSARTDTWSDVFSLGVILFQLISGRLPFPMREVGPGEYAGELLRYMRWRTTLADVDLPACSGAPPALESVLRKALRHDPRERQPDARELQQDLQRFLETGEGISEREVTRTEAISLAELERIAAEQEPATPTPSSPAFGELTTSVQHLASEDLIDEELDTTSSSIHSAETAVRQAFAVAETASNRPRKGRDEAEPRALKKKAPKSRRWLEAPTLVEDPPRHPVEPDETTDVISPFDDAACVELPPLFDEDDDPTQ